MLSADVAVSIDIVYHNKFGSMQIVLPGVGATSLKPCYTTDVVVVKGILIILSIKNDYLIGSNNSGRL